MTDDTYSIGTGKFKPVVRDGRLIITVIGKTHEDLYDPAARRFAWEYRTNPNCPPAFGTAGIEQIGNVTPIEEGGKTILIKKFMLTPRH